MNKNRLVFQSVVVIIFLIGFIVSSRQGDLSINIIVLGISVIGIVHTYLLYRKRSNNPTSLSGDQIIALEQADKNWQEVDSKPISRWLYIMSISFGIFLVIAVGFFLLIYFSK